MPHILYISYIYRPPAHISYYISLIYLIHSFISQKETQVKYLIHFHISHIIYLIYSFISQMAYLVHSSELIFRSKLPTLIEIGIERVSPDSDSGSGSGSEVLMSKYVPSLMM